MNPRLSIEPTRKFRLLVAVGLAVFSALLLLFFAWLNWALRDGLGPGFVESFGWEAFRRFWPDFWPVAVFCCFLFVVAYFVAPRSRCRST